MTRMVTIAATALLAASSPLAAQTAAPLPAPTPTAEATPDLTEAEQKTLKKCAAMTPVQQAQSSKCSKVMVKAGKDDPAKARAPSAPEG